MNNSVNAKPNFDVRLGKTKNRMDLGSVCRTCLANGGELFEVFGETGMELSLPQKLVEHLKISVSWSVNSAGNKVVTALDFLCGDFLFIIRCHLMRSMRGDSVLGSQSI